LPLAAPLWLVTLALAGCGEGIDVGGSVERAASDPSAPTLTQTEAEKSAVISGLLARRTVLPGGSSLDQVADAVLDANARAAESELRAARLRAVAASRNWLPTLGPVVSLDNMGDVVAQLLVEQVLFNGGRLKAERRFAAADVEVAAVALAEDTNARVATALGLYTEAERGRAAAVRSAQALERMRGFEHIMQRRVDGGVSSPSDLSVVRQKRQEVEANLASDQQSATAAIAELNAMSARPLDGVRGLSHVSTAPGAEAGSTLAVLRAQAESTRAAEQAKVARSGFLPNVTASIGVDQDGSVGDGGRVNVGVENGVGFGTGATLKSLEAAEESASRQVAQTREDAARRLAGLRAERTRLADQLGRAESLARDAHANYQQFQRQYESGFRSVMDVVGTFETYLRLEREANNLRHDLVRAEIEIARDLGLLVDGDRI